MSNRNSSTEFGSLWPHPYLDALETKKKKKPGLAHDIGKGAPCLRCGDKCPGLDLHYWRKVCRACRCAKEDHDVKDDEDPGMRRVGRLFDEPLARPVLPTTSRIYGSSAQSEIQYEWVPPGVSGTLALKYIQSLPPERQPLKGSDGANFRKRQLERQIPEHDLNPQACDNLTPAEENMLTMYVEDVKKNVVGQGVVAEQPSHVQWHCVKCHGPMFPGDVAIFAARAGNDKCWHPACFTCCTCSEVLQDLIYFFKAGKLYCGRHFADSVLPRCAACDELIFNKAYTQAENRPWHVKHFCCQMCDKPLAGCEYIPRDQNPYCMECYDKAFGKICSTCEKKILPTEKRISFNDIHYHAVPECFHCAFCGNSLMKSRFISKPPKVFCTAECHRNYVGGQH